MKKSIGLWIDHRKAVIVSLAEDGQRVRELASHVEADERNRGGEPGSRRSHRFTNRLNKYYDRVISAIRDSGAILILGPGEAKVEFEKRLKAEAPGGFIAGVETVDRMTRRQLAAVVRRRLQ